MVALVVAFCTWTFFAITSDADDRRNQACQLFEAQYRTKALNIQRTYDYLGGLTPKEKRDKLNVAVAGQLASNEQDLRASVPPEFCTQPDHGNLPPIPRRPAEL